MTISRNSIFQIAMCALVSAAAVAPLSAANALQTRVVQPAYIAPSRVQFQQTVQQQQTRSNLEKSQQQAQRQQQVSDNIRRSSADNAHSQQQRDEADKARQNREWASQQAQLQRDEDAAALPRVVPQPLPPPKPKSNGG